MAAPARGVAKRYRRSIAYLIVGAWNTLFGYVVFALLYFMLQAHLHVDAILLLSYLLATANAYIGYRYVVFRSTRSVGRELRRFVAVYAVTLAVNLVVLPLALHLLPWNVYIVQGLFTGIVVVLSYLGHKHFTFRSDASGQEG